MIQPTREDEMDDLAVLIIRPEGEEIPEEVVHGFRMLAKITAKQIREKDQSEEGFVMSELGFARILKDS